MIVNEKYKFSDLTSKIIKCAMNVHSALGNGFQEVIYQRALEIEFKDKAILFTRERELPIYYRNQQIGTRKMDFLVNNIICIELKAVSNLEDIHLAQAINYLEAFELEVGLLINFGAPSLQFRRVINRKFKQLDQGNPLIK